VKRSFPEIVEYYKRSQRIPPEMIARLNSTEDLRSLLEDPAANTFWPTLVWTLAAAGDKGDIEFLINYIRRPETLDTYGTWISKQGAVVAIGKYGGPEATEFLLSVLSEQGARELVSKWQMPHRDNSPDTVGHVAAVLRGDVAEALLLTGDPANVVPVRELYAELVEMLGKRFRTREEYERVYKSLTDEERFADCVYGHVISVLAEYDLKCEIGPDVFDALSSNERLNKAQPYWDKYQVLCPIKGKWVD
jgi:hypothetical protein